jgi:hypothetical protein
MSYPENLYCLVIDGNRKASMKILAFKLEVRKSTYSVFINYLAIVVASATESLTRLVTSSDVLVTTS